MRAVLKMDRYGNVGADRVPNGQKLEKSAEANVAGIRSTIIIGGLVAVGMAAGYFLIYKKYSVILGRQIVFISAGEKQNALAQDIDKDGGLVVLMPDNTIKTLFSGEISVRWAD